MAALYFALPPSTHGTSARALSLLALCFSTPLLSFCVSLAASATAIVPDTDTASKEDAGNSTTVSPLCTLSATPCAAPSATPTTVPTLRTQRHKQIRGKREKERRGGGREGGREREREREKERRGGGSGGRERLAICGSL